MGFVMIIVVNSYVDCSLSSRVEVIHFVVVLLSIFALILVFLRQS